MPNRITSEVPKPNVPAARIPPNVKMPERPSRNTAEAIRNHRVCGEVTFRRTIVRHSALYEASRLPWRAGERRSMPSSRKRSSRVGSTSGRKRSRVRIRISSGTQKMRHQAAANRVTARMLRAPSSLKPRDEGDSTKPHSTTARARMPPM